MTVVATSTSISPAAHARIPRSFSSVLRRPCSAAIRTEERAGCSANSAIIALTVAMVAVPSGAVRAGAPFLRGVGDGFSRRGARGWATRCRAPGTITQGHLPRLPRFLINRGTHHERLSALLHLLCKPMPDAVPPGGTNGQRHYLRRDRGAIRG